MAERREVVSDETGQLGAVLARVAEFVARGEVAGAGLAVARGGRLVAEGYWGQARPEQAAGPDILWPLASISKLYTAAAVMALVERGELTLSQPVSRFLPELAGEGREAITLRQLLTHTSGLIYESPQMEQVLLRHTPLDGILDEAYGHPLLFAPGAGYSYSDFGIGLAGRVAARAAGTPFPELVRELVLDPAGLEQTFMPPPAAAYARVATVAGVFAFGTDAAMYNSPYALALGHPAFGAVASVRDLLRFGLLFGPASGGHRILSEATIRAMTTDQTGGEARDHLSGLRRPWGLGFSVRASASQLGLGDLTSPSAFGHPGASGCTLVIDPSYDLALAYVSNQHGLSGWERWNARLDTVVNGVLAALTRRPG